MKQKIGFVVFILTLVSSSIYFMFTEQSVKKIDYVDGPYVFSVNDSTYKVIEIEPDSDESTRPEVVLNYSHIQKSKFISDFLDGKQSNEAETSTKESFYSNIDSVFIVGDVHGEFEALMSLLETNNIITEDLKWNFGKGHVVFCGDVFDRGDQVTESLWFIYKLEMQAEALGGKVHFLLGNHEMMVLQGNLKYLHKKYKYIQSKLGVRYSFLYHKNTLLGKWLREQNTIVNINDVIYVHGGLHPEIIDIGLGIPEINQKIREHLKNEDFDEEIRFLISPKGPLWYRGYLRDGKGYSMISEEELDGILNHFNADKIIFAHTTVKHIQPMFNDKVIAIDVPMSKEKSEALFFKNNKFYSTNQQGDTVKLF